MKKLIVISLAGVCVLIGVMLYTRQRQIWDFQARTACVGNLAYLRVAKSVCSDGLNLREGDSVPSVALMEYLGKRVEDFKCSKGGSYTLGKFGELPSCSYTKECFTYEFDASTFRVQRRVWVHALVSFR